MHTIAISNQKGGCGKTTSAINLAASLAALGKRTLLIDLDPQAHATFGLGLRGEEGSKASMYNILTDRSEKKMNFLENVLVPVSEMFDLAPSHLLLSTIEQELSDKDESVSKLYDAIRALSFPYDFVVIDCPPSLGFLTFNALRAAQTVIVPLELASFSLMGVGKLLSMIELLSVKLQHAPKIYALPTMVDLRTRFSKHMADEIKRTFGDHVLNSVIRQTVVVRESQAKGVPLVKHNPKSKAAIDYLILAQEVVNKTSAEFSAPASLREEKKLPFNLADHLRDFIFKAAGVREVHLVGDFNNWSVNHDSLLWQKEEGLWQKRLFLKPGRYRYKFVIDGKWQTDPGNYHLEPNPYGGLDSILEIE